MVQLGTDRSFVKKSYDFIKGMMECFLFMINSFFATAGSQIESSNYREEDLRDMQYDGDNFKLWNNRDNSTNNNGNNN